MPCGYLTSGIGQALYHSLEFCEACDVSVSGRTTSRVIEVLPRLGLVYDIGLTSRK
jgi:hypothetical protein